MIHILFRLCLNIRIKDAMQPVSEFITLMEFQNPQNAASLGILAPMDFQNSRIQPVGESINLKDFWNSRMQPVSESINTMDFQNPRMQPVSKSITLVEFQNAASLQIHHPGRIPECSQSPNPSPW